jgi:Predicted amidophosphoribosyltransferases
MVNSQPTDHLRSGLRLLLGGAVCRSCGGRAAIPARLCAVCLTNLPWNRRACPHCAVPVPCAETPCGRCAKRPLFERATVPLLLRTPVREWVHLAKYRASFADAELLAHLFVEAIARQRSARLPDLIVPVPLHSGRLRRRGYNQAVVLAGFVARQLGVGFVPDRVRRIRATPDQIGLDAAHRRRNLRGAFAADNTLEGKNIALFDDVLTTGSTLAELARSCRSAGARSVEVWAIARTVGRHRVP